MLVTSPTYTRPNEKSHDGNGTCTKEEEKGIYNEGITQIPNDDSNPTVRDEGTRLGRLTNHKLLLVCLSLMVSLEAATNGGKMRTLSASHLGES